MKYYYPVNKKVEVNIYQYVNPQDSEFNEYWKTTTNPTPGTILTESFDPKFNLYNTFEEKVTSKNAELIRYVEYENGKEVKATVKDNNVYNSNKLDSYNYAVEYSNEFGRFIFEKRRQFVKFEEIKIQGKKYKTAKFKDEYYINAIERKDKYEFSQITFYAEGIGMVKYERSLPTGEVRVLELTKILSADEFEKIKKEVQQ